MTLRLTLLIAKGNHFLMNLKQSVLATVTVVDF